MMPDFEAAIHCPWCGVVDYEACDYPRGLREDGDDVSWDCGSCERMCTVTLAVSYSFQTTKLIGYRGSIVIAGKRFYQPTRRTRRGAMLAQGRAHVLAVRAWPEGTRIFSVPPVNPVSRREVEDDDQSPTEEPT